MIYKSLHLTPLYTTIMTNSTTLCIFHIALSSLLSTCTSTIYYNRNLFLAYTRSKPLPTDGTCFDYGSFHMFLCTCLPFLIPIIQIQPIRLLSLLTWPHYNTIYRVCVCVCVCVRAHAHVYYPSTILHEASFVYNNSQQPYHEIIVRKTILIDVLMGWQL